MLSKDTLQTTAKRSMIVLATARVRVVAQSLVSVSSDRIRRQSVQDLLLVSSASVEPSLHLVEHHSLNLGWEGQHRVCNASGLLLTVRVGEGRVE